MKEIKLLKEDRKRKKKKKRRKEEKNKNKISNNVSKSKSMTLKSKINNGLLIDKIPFYNNNIPIGEDDALDKINNDVRQFIIESNVYRDEDFDILISNQFLLDRLFLIKFNIILLFS